jgi:hypothetical protein
MAKLLGGTRVYGNTSIDGYLFLGNTALNTVGNTLGIFVNGGGIAAGSITSRGSITVTTTGVMDSLGVGTPASGVTGEIRATSTVTANYSDGRLKDVEGTILNPIDKVNQLSGVYYRANEVAASYGYTDNKKQVGVIAQEVEKVLPEIVVPAPFDIGKNDDGHEYSLSGKNYKTVHYEKIIPLLIEAIKAQQIQIDELKKLYQENLINKS